MARQPASEYFEERDAVEVIHSPVIAVAGNVAPAISLWAILSGTSIDQGQGLDPERTTAMKLQRPTPDQVALGLRAMCSVARAKGRPLEDAEKAMLAAVQRFFGTDFDTDALSDITPDELAEALPDPQIRRQLIDALIVFALIDGEAEEAEVIAVDDYARALGVADKALRNLAQLARHEHVRVRIDVLRRFWAVDKLRERVQERGLGEVLRFVKANVGRLEDPAMAARFRAWRDLPDGALGREYIRFLDDNGWALPGERGALSDIIVFHDMTHVLSGYGTDPAGEVETACFSAGYRKKEPFTFVLFVLLQFHIGIRVAPAAQAETGHFDVERALTALHRGAAMNLDLTEDWDYHAVADVPIDELRRRYGIPPLGDPRPAGPAV